MSSLSLNDLAAEHLALAAQASSGRSATTVHGGREHRLRQTMIAMVAGQSLGEHSSPGEATLQTLRGRIVLRTVNESSGDASYELGPGDFITIPNVRHSVDAIEDAVFLLTVDTGK
jgi:quercetin dioxygenase-like cupin family protein